MKIYEALGIYLSGKGIKQKFVAQKINLSTSLFSMILNGKRKLDSEELINILIVLGIEPNEFLNPILKERRQKKECLNCGKPRKD